MTKKQAFSVSKKNPLHLTLTSVFITFICTFGITEVFGGYCGSVDLIDPRISGGSETKRGEWPFLAALYYVEHLKFFCGGTLISKQHVLTAAHCVQNKDSSMKLDAFDVLVILGAYNLSIRERGVFQSEVNSIYVHPDWKVYSDHYDADLAVFVLTAPVQFTNYIRPVCMPSQNSVFEGARGSIVGWGLADKGAPSLEHPRHAFTYALNASYCLTMDPYLAFLSSTRTFCGTGGDGSPNKGDSGGGFFVLSGSAWVQFGIISALRINATGLVDENSVAIYTNVKLFNGWINEVVEKSGGEHKIEVVAKGQDAAGKHKVDVTTASSVAPKSINLDCYGDNAYFGYVASYTCEVPDLDIQTPHSKVASIAAYHVSGKSDQDVQRIIFFNGTMVYLPDGIGRIFKNLKVFVVSSDIHFKFVERSNFKNLEKLIHFHIYRNEIETFEESTLYDLPQLELFTLYKNNLEVIHENTFEKNPKLREIDLRWNKLRVLPKDLFKRNLLLEEAYFTGNSLSTILVDFSVLRNIRRLNFNDNVCVDATAEVNFNDLYKQIRENCI